MRENLWLNLTDGAVLCGKWFFDGSGGNGHALDHYKQNKYPLAVKLDTITPDGAGLWHKIGSPHWRKLNSKHIFISTRQQCKEQHCIVFEIHKPFSKLFVDYIKLADYNKAFCLWDFLLDVYSFEEEEAVLDPHISEHLSHFGIDMLQMQQRVEFCFICFVFLCVVFVITPKIYRCMCFPSWLHFTCYRPKMATTQITTPGHESVNGRWSRSRVWS